VVVKRFVNLFISSQPATARVGASFIPRHISTLPTRWSRVNRRRQKRKDELVFDARCANRSAERKGLADLESGVSYKRYGLKR
jgi:hypothetical protein